MAKCRISFYGGRFSTCHLSNRGISWVTKDGVHRTNYFGSLTHASTCHTEAYSGEEIYVPFKSLLPLVDPNDVILGGWDIFTMNLADAMACARVFDINLQKQLRPYMQDMVPLPGVYDPDFIAANQGARADNCIQGTNMEELEQLRKDIRYMHCHSEAG
ncbi:hypothetical protein R1sor_000023 [Riccia sorocarpa]|uniref:Inositol-3-phosphate synthase n=1 Tax=Riccia sorocarpa TaxID=122646 RepID=A0ABD3GW21_9MARC